MSGIESKIFAFVIDLTNLVRIGIRVVLRVWGERVGCPGALP